MTEIKMIIIFMSFAAVMVFIGVIAAVYLIKIYKTLDDINSLERNNHMLLTSVNNTTYTVFSKLNEIKEETVKRCEYDNSFTINCDYICARLQQVCDKIDTGIRAIEINKIAEISDDELVNAVRKCLDSELYRIIKEHKDDNNNN